MAFVNITGVSILGPGWSNASGSYQGSSSYGLQEALSFGGTQGAFDGLEDVSDIVQYRGNHSLYYDYSWTRDELAERLNSSVDAIFFEHACPQENCAAACDGEFATMFEVNGLHTIHNCLLAPYFAVANLTSTNDAFLKDRYNLGSALNVTAQNVVYRVNECLRSICSSLSGCDIPDHFSSNFTTDWPDVYYNYLNSSSLLTQVCSSVPSVVNADLGGIGVYVSYWIQSGLAILGFAVTMMFIVLIPRARLGLLSLRRGRLEAQFQAEYIHRRARKRMSPFVAALTEFHKQQCFFMLATNIAALVVVQRGGFDPESFQQIYQNYTFLNEIALSGILPITFTLFNLYLISMISWYLIFLSCLSIILSIATLAVVGHFSPSQSDLNVLAEIASKGGPQECGGMQPHVYCFDSYTASSFYDGSSTYDETTVLFSNPSIQLTAFCMVVLFLIVMYKLKPHRWKASGWLSALSLNALGKTAAQFKRFSQTELVRNSASSISRFANVYWTRSSRLADIYWTKLMMKSPQYVEASVSAIVRWSSAGMEWLQGWIHRRNWKKLALAFFKFALYATIIGFYLYSFIDYMARLTLFSVSKSWNFGQIVAITVWFPPACEYVHLSIRGMRRGFNHRLLSPYRVTSRATTAETLVAEEDPHPNFDDRASVTTGASIGAVPLRKYPKHRSEPPDDEAILIGREPPPGRCETNLSRPYSKHRSGPRDDGSSPLLRDSPPQVHETGSSRIYSKHRSEPQDDGISLMRRDSPPLPHETQPSTTYSKHHTEPRDDESILIRRDSPPKQHETESFRNETWHDGMSYDSVRGGRGKDSPEQTVATEPVDRLLPEVQLPSRSFSMGLGRRRSHSAGWR